MSVSGQKTKGIILRKTVYGENDIIFDLLNEEGKMLGFFARGAKKIKSRFSGVLQLGHVVEVAYSTGKNLQYPNEITLIKKHLYSFCSKTMQGMNFYADILSIARVVAKDLEAPELYESVVTGLDEAERGGDLLKTYNTLLENILYLIGVETELTCYYSGELISENQFYYAAEINRVISKSRKPETIDLPLVTFDPGFFKEYLKKLVYEHVQSRLKLKF